MEMRNVTTATTLEQVKKQLVGDDPVKERIAELLDEKFYLLVGEGGMLKTDVDLPYDFELPEKFVKDLLDETATGDDPDFDPEMWIEERLYECLVEGYLCDDIFDIEKTVSEEFDLDFDDVHDLIEEMFYFNLPVEEVLEKTVCVNIGMDTGDGNYDYTLNTYNPAYQDIDGGMDGKASLVWLAYQQGYSRKTLDEVLYRDGVANSKFLESVQQEVANTGSHMNLLMFLVKMSLGGAIRINEMIRMQDANGHNYDATKNPYCGYIVLEKKTNTGLYDPWYGCGSLFEIELERDAVVPIRFIRSATLDGGDGYPIKSVYGVSSSFWTDNGLKQIRPISETLRKKYLARGKIYR